MGLGTKRSNSRRELELVGEKGLEPPQSLFKKYQ